MKFLDRLFCFSMTIILFSCSKPKPCTDKDQICDQSLVTLTNSTHDTLFWGKGTNYYTDTLLPGKKKNWIAGEVKVTFDPKDDCKKKKNFMVNSTASHKFWRMGLQYRLL